MKVRVPVDFIFNVASEEEAKVRAEEFLLRSVMEFRQLYNVEDYEIPYGCGEDTISK